MHFTCFLKACTFVPAYGHMDQKWSIVERYWTQ